MQSAELMQEVDFYAVDHPNRTVPSRMDELKNGGSPVVVNEGEASLNSTKLKCAGWPKSSFCPVKL